MKKISACRACKNRQIKTFFDLDRQPLANSLLQTQNQKEDKYPLALSWCVKCNLVQLNHTVPPKKLFANYVWVTGTSETARDFADKFYRALINRSPFSKKGLVLEIASNDGTFLQPFKKGGYKVLGVDPARNIAKIAEEQGIPTRQWFFGASAAKSLIRQYGCPRFVFARNVLPHVANTRDFVRGLKMCLADQSIAAIEVHYGKKIIEELHYDSIYHEHLCYFTVKSLESLLNSFGLFVFDIEKSSISGGSIIVYLRNHRIPERPAVAKYRLQESTSKVNRFSSWKNFADQAYVHKNLLISALKKASDAGETIIGYGASARSSTLLNFCGIDSKNIRLIADKNTLKHNKFTAGSRIKIVDPALAMKTKPSLIFILAWNFADEIMKLLRRDFSYNGKYIIPLPVRPRILRS